MRLFTIATLCLTLSVATAPGCSSSHSDVAASRNGAASWRNEAGVHTQWGPVEASADRSETWSWKAIPFAKPPVGTLRWRAPQTPDTWTSPLKSATFSSDCMQLAGAGSDMEGSEDCLYLNVWRPQSTDKSLPVYVWFYGGGNSTGSAALSDIDGANLAHKAGFVVVTLNYRVGPLGWFSNSALATGSAEDNSGNYGTLDIIKALQWVHDNIRAFGGDPGNVTIAGESAGGINVLSMLMSPAASGLFQRAIAQSAVRTSSGMDAAMANGNQALARILVAKGLAADSAAATALLAAMPTSQRKDFLYNLTPAELFNAYPRVTGNLLSIPSIFADGVVIHRDGIDSFSNGTYPNKVPLILSTMKDEVRALASQNLFSNRALFNVVATYGSDLWKASSLDELARSLTQYQNDVYVMRFLWGAYIDGGGSQIPTPYDFFVGAAHGMDVPFIFGNDPVFYPSIKDQLFTAENKAGRDALSTAMITYVSSFARSGNPNSAANHLPTWYAWSNQPHVEKLMEFNSVGDSASTTMSTLELNKDGVLADMRAHTTAELYNQAYDYLLHFSMTCVFLLQDSGADLTSCE